MRSHFHAEQWLPHPPQQVFAFFSEPANLPRLLPAWQRARIEEAHLIAPPAPPHQPARTAAAGDGSSIVLSFRPFPFSPVRMQWDARISHFRWNEQFCDTQFRGPFLYWHHCHRIFPAADPATNAPGTLLRDEVEYELPFGPLGALAHPLIALQLASLFRNRHRRTAELLAR